MVKYTISPHWKGYFKEKYGKYCNYYKDLPYDLFVEYGWPTQYIAKYHAIHFLPDIVFFSKTKLKYIPVYGFLIPKTFFKEEIV